MNHTGGCLCGRVRYRVGGVLGPLVYCHCVQCRKAQGVAFAANVPVAAEHFELVAGGDALTAFRASQDKTRYFCSNCGSALYSYLDGAASVRIRAGTLDGAVKLEPGAHIFVASKAPWVNLDDDLPQYPAREPGRR